MHYYTSVVNDIFAEITVIAVMILASEHPALTKQIANKMTELFQCRGLSQIGKLVWLHYRSEQQK